MNESDVESGIEIEIIDDSEMLSDHPSI